MRAGGRRAATSSSIWRGSPAPSAAWRIRGPISTSTAAATWCCSRRCARDNPRAKLVFVGSRLAVRHAVGAEPVDEEHAPDPLCVHAVHKLTVEQYLQLYGRLYGLRSRVARLTNPYGPGQPRGRTAYGVVNRMIHLALAGQTRCRSTATARSGATTSTSTMPSTRCSRWPSRRASAGRTLQRRQRRRHAAGRHGARRSSRSPAAAASNSSRGRALAEQIETGDFVADISRIRARARLGAARRARRRPASGRSRSTGRTSRRDGPPRARRLSRARVHGRRRRGDGAQPGAAPAADGSSRWSAASRGRSDRRGDPQDRHARSRCSGSTPASGGRWRLVGIRRYLRETAADIVHTFLLTASLYGRLAAILARVPIVIGTEVNIYEHKRPHHALAERLLMARHRSRRRVGRIGARFLRATGARRSRPRSTSSTTPSTSRRLQPDDVAGARCAPRSACRPDAPVAGIIARLTEQKGHRYLFEALASTPALADVHLLVDRRRRTARRARARRRRAGPVGARALPRRAPRSRQSAGGDGRVRHAVALGRPAALAGAGDGRRPAGGRDRGRRHSRGRRRRARPACSCPPATPPRSARR